MPITVEEIKDYLNTEITFHRLGLYNGVPEVGIESRGAIRALNDILDYIETKESEVGNE